MCKSVRSNVRKLGVAAFMAVLATVAGTKAVFGAAIPPGCTGGSQISFKIFADAAGTIDITFNTFVPGEVVYYQAILEPTFNQCAISNGFFNITTPDGAKHDATPPGGIPLVCNGIGCPAGSVATFGSLLIPYTVNAADLGRVQTNTVNGVVLGQCSDPNTGNPVTNDIQAVVQYYQGVQFCGQPCNGNANASPCNPVLIPCLTVTKQIACDVNGGCSNASYGSSATGVVSAATGQIPVFCYKITIANCGTDPLVISNINDSIFGDLTAEFTNSDGAVGGTLLSPAGGPTPSTATIYFSAAENQGEINTVTAQANEQIQNQLLIAQSSATSVVSSVSIACTKTVSSPDDLDGNANDNHVTLPGDLNAHQVIWKIVVNNNGSWPLSGVSISDSVLNCTFPAPFSLGVGSSFTFLCTNNNVSCGDLGIGGAINNTATVTGNADSLNGTICVTDTNGNPVSTFSSCFASVVCTGHPDVAITKLITCIPPSLSCSDPSLVYGKSATGVVSGAECPAFCYSVIVSNRGSETLQNITVTDNSPDNKPSLASCVWPDLAPGSSETCQVSATHCNVGNTMDVATVVAVGAITGQSVSNSDSAVATVLPISISCVKNANGQPGDLSLSIPPTTTTDITFSVTIRNTGSVDLQNIGVVDTGACTVSTNVPFLASGGSITVALCTVTSTSCPPQSTLSDTVTITAEVSSSANVCTLQTNGLPVTTSSSCQNTVNITCLQPGCRTTGGGKQPSANTCPVVNFTTHGGQVGAPFGVASAPDCATGVGFNNPCIRGEFQHVRHGKGNASGNFHASSNGNEHDFDSLLCACLPCDHTDTASPFGGCHPDDRSYSAQNAVVNGLCNPGDRVCGPEPRHAPANKICFSGVGDYIAGHGKRAENKVVFRVDLEDRSEPGGAHPKGGTPPPDRYRMRMWIVSPSAVDSAAVKALRATVACKDPLTEVIPATLDCVGGATPAPDIDDGGDLDRGNRQIHPNTGASCNQ